MKNAKVYKCSWVPGHNTPMTLKSRSCLLCQSNSLCALKLWSPKCMRVSTGVRKLN